jgi:hypothetical protein
MIVAVSESGLLRHDRCGGAFSSCQPTLTITKDIKRVIILPSFCCQSATTGEQVKQKKIAKPNTSHKNPTGCVICYTFLLVQRESYY